MTVDQFCLTSFFNGLNSNIIYGKSFYCEANHFIIKYLNEFKEFH